MNGGRKGRGGWAIVVGIKLSADAVTNQSNNQLPRWNGCSYKGTWHRNKCNATVSGLHVKQQYKYKWGDQVPSSHNMHRYSRYLKGSSHISHLTLICLPKTKCFETHREQLSTNPGLGTRGWDEWSSILKVHVGVLTNSMFRFMITCTWAQMRCDFFFSVSACLFPCISDHSTGRSPWFACCWEWNVSWGPSTPREYPRWMYTTQEIIRQVPRGVCAVACPELGIVVYS